MNSQSSYLSESERRYLIDGIVQGIRLDGRSCFDFRPYSVQTGVIPSANGSARVFTEDTDAIVVVKCEVTRPSERTPDEGNLIIRVECPNAAVFDYEGFRQETFRQYYSDLLNEFCASSATFDRRALSILPSIFCWTIYVDITLLKGGGSFVDVISIGMRAALSETIIPAVSHTAREEATDTDESTEYRIEVDPRESAGKPFPVDDIPICITVGQIHGHYVWDMTAEEAACANSTVLVAIDKNGRNVGIRKCGVGSVELSVLIGILQNSQATGKAMIEKVDTTLRNINDGRERFEEETLRPFFEV